MKKSSPKDARKEFSLSFPSFILNIFMAYLLWLFAVSIFIPLSIEISGGDGLTPLISFIFLVAILTFIVKAAYDGKSAVDSLAILASEKKPNHERKQRYIVVRNGGYMVLIVILSIVMIPLLMAIHPVFAGIALVSALILFFVLLLPLMPMIIDRIVARL
ncbi:MAG: hypothetical protein H3Z50_01905 [archaeon]|nr:hypothetical protein [archaeon]MCP8305538.1 hypothetical protein [archaeon]